MPKDPVLDILEHHGIKGMKWGVRRPKGPGGLVSKKPAPRSSTDYKTTAPLRKRPPHTLTNMQLKKVNERQQLEQKFAKMNPTMKQKGKAYTDELLKATVGVGLFGAVVKLSKSPEAQAFILKKLKPGKHFAKVAVETTVQTAKHLKK